MNKITHIGRPLKEIPFNKIYTGMRVVFKNSYSIYLGAVVAKKQIETHLGNYEQLVIDIDGGELFKIEKLENANNWFYVEGQ